MKGGEVLLIGAGPGDPGLITWKGIQALREADVVIYDHLVAPELLEHCREGCELIYVGKQSGSHTLSQQEINRLMVRKATEGLRVVRLKGGDPFLFGRGGEEAQALRRAAIRFQVVPGVTSAIAAPAYAGIPVTHRDHSSSVAIVTGHEDQNKTCSNIRWERLSGAADTLVFLMGVKNLSFIVEKLLVNGRDPSTPAALIQWGTTPGQRVFTAPLRAIVEKAHEAKIGPPAVLVVGDVVCLREQLNWVEDLPLWGKRILVTRAREQASDLAQRLRLLGAQAVEFPTISIGPPSDLDLLDRAISQLGDYQWVVFTSPNGVRWFFERLREKGKDCRALAGLSIAVIGPGTEKALERRGLRADLVPAEFRAEALAEALSEVDLKGKRVLVARAEEARDVLPMALLELGALVNVVPVYKTVLPQPREGQLESILAGGSLDAITFTSSSTVRNLVALAGVECLHKLLDGVTVACIGPVTAQTARQHGIDPHVVASNYTIEGLVEALVSVLGPRRLER
ncbi:MAG: uroporphyrinogen-III C-methyltransferase [Thermodesulfobacteriota bacterium]